jgi:hypothetical protein
MIRVIAIASLAFAVATSAQALTPAPMPQPEGLVSLIAAACGAGRHGLTACARQEPPSARPAEPSADVRPE